MIASSGFALVSHRLASHLPEESASSGPRSGRIIALPLRHPGAGWSSGHSALPPLI